MQNENQEPTTEQAADPGASTATETTETAETKTEDVSIIETESPLPAAASSEGSAEEAAAGH